MTTLEDKILGEKKEYYCSSSEDEEENPDNSEREQAEDIQNIACSGINNLDTWNGTCSNTGPKGVLHDWKRFKQLESEKKAQNDKKYLQLFKQFSVTCKSTLDEDKEKENQEDQELDELLEDEFLMEYQRNRMKEMLSKVQKFKFSTVINLNSADEFLSAIDDEDKSVTIIVHIYEPKIPGCEAMNGCLISLAQEYPYVKFCKILGSAVGLSKHFKKEGVPALLAYKNGQVIGNFIHVTDTLGTDFYVSDVENYLLEHGIIMDKKSIPKIIANCNEESD